MPHPMWESLAALVVKIGAGSWMNLVMNNAIAALITSVVIIVCMSPVTTSLRQAVVVRSAVLENRSEIDPTDGAQFFNLRPNDSQKPFQGHEIKTHDGPFKNSFPSSDLPRGKDVYVNTYKYVPPPPKRSGPIHVREQAHARRMREAYDELANDAPHGDKGPFVLSEALACLMTHSWVRTELRRIGVFERGSAFVRHRSGAIPNTE